jgi:hypothetical protein
MKLATLPQKKTKKSAPEPSKSAPEVEMNALEGLSTAPRYLSKRMKTFWASILATRKLQPHEAAILLEACVSFDRAEAARKVLQKGLTYTDRFGAPRPRPEIAVERESRLVFAKLIKQLDLHVHESWP